MAQNIEPPPSRSAIVANQMPTTDYNLWFLNIYEFIRTYITSNGIQLPQLTTTQRNAIQNPPNGLTIYNTTIDEPQMVIAGAWKNLLHT